MSEWASTKLCALYASGFAVGNVLAFLLGISSAETMFEGIYFGTTAFGLSAFSFRHWAPTPTESDRHG